MRSPKEDALSVATAGKGDQHNTYLSRVVVAAYQRRELGQTGDGHFSPVGAYVASKDMVLIFDVARFKYPPHWVSLQTLWNAMTSINDFTGRSRGFFSLEKSSKAPQCQAQVHTS